jgi:hypothetical protein
MPKVEKNLFLKIGRKVSPRAILLGLGVVFVVSLIILVLMSRRTNNTPKLEAKKASLRLEPGSGSFKVGEEFVVKIILDTGDFETDATDVRISYDPTMVTITKVTEGQIYDDYPAKRIDSGNGMVIVNAITSLTKTFKGKETFAALNLKGIKKGKAVLLIAFNPGATNDSNVVGTKISKDILEEAEGATFEIE